MPTIPAFATRVEYTRLASECDAVNLGQGFPDFPPPDFAVDAFRQALSEDFMLNQYTNAFVSHCPWEGGGRSGCVLDSYLILSRPHASWPRGVRQMRNQLGQRLFLRAQEKEGDESRKEEKKSGKSPWRRCCLNQTLQARLLMEPAPSGLGQWFLSARFPIAMPGAESWPCLSTPAACAAALPESLSLPASTPSLSSQSLSLAQRSASYSSHVG